MVEKIINLFRSYEICKILILPRQNIFLHALGFFYIYKVVAKCDH